MIKYVVLRENCFLLVILTKSSDCHSACSKSSMKSRISSNSSSKRLLSLKSNKVNSEKSNIKRAPSDLSVQDIQFPKVIENNEEVEEQTVLQVEIVNEELLRIRDKAQLGSKGTLLTYRWQAALTVGIVSFLLVVGISGLAYWATIPKIITQPYLLYGESCYPNSRSCDASRMLWCPAGRCLCIGDFTWNATGLNCSCGVYQTWNNVKCENDGYYGDPCDRIRCRPTLTCMKLVNQTYTTQQSICTCDNTTYLVTSGGSAGNCEARLTYNTVCQTKYDCQDWLGLTCRRVGGTTRCRCSSNSYWNGTICASNALGWEYCSNPSVPCDTTRGLTCVSNACDCGQFYYWNNVSTFTCEEKKTYSVACDYTFQCNTTVGLRCSSNGTNCNCPATSTAYICDCQAGKFWDGQRCVNKHSFNGTCPGQYACADTGNFVCYLGHCICPGNMVWNALGANRCDCPSSKTWNSVLNTCM